MLWQCFCCGYFSDDHLKISKHMKEMHNIKFEVDKEQRITSQMDMDSMSKKLFS